MQQLRTHRVGISFDVQSFRYSGNRIVDVVEGRRQVEEVFYLRPVGSYTDRHGSKYEYTQEHRNFDLDYCFQAAILYRQRLLDGFSEEHARGLIPFDVRQHWVMSVNARSLMHLLDLRWKKDAQLECQQFCDLLFPHFQVWMPEVADWYLENRAKKARLAP
jgi:thymidylate synthase (FAD)